MKQDGYKIMNELSAALLRRAAGKANTKGAATYGKMIAAKVGPRNAGSDVKVKLASLAGKKMNQAKKFAAANSKKTRQHLPG